MGDKKSQRECTKLKHAKFRSLIASKDGRKSIQYHVSESSTPDEMWPVIVAHGLEFFRPSGSAMPVGVYKVTLLLQESDYCGGHAAKITDSTLLDITPGPLNAEILGGSESIIFVLQKSILTLARTDREHAEINIVRWSCQRRILGETERPVQSLRSGNVVSVNKIY